MSDCCFTTSLLHVCCFFSLVCRDSIMSQATTWQNQHILAFLKFMHFASLTAKSSTIRVICFPLAFPCRLLLSELLFIPYPANLFSSCSFGWGSGYHSRNYTFLGFAPRHFQRGLQPDRFLSSLVLLVAMA